LKTIIVMCLLVLLLGGIIGTSFNVFKEQKQSSFVTMVEQTGFLSTDKMSIRQIDSLSAASNLSFTIKNAIR